VKRLWFVTVMHTKYGQSALCGAWVWAAEAHHAIETVEAAVVAEHGKGQMSSHVLGAGDFAEQERLAGRTSSATRGEP
jgi:hypothetical protein